MSPQNKRKGTGGASVDDEYTEDVTTTSKRAKTAKSGPSKHRAKAFEEETEEERNARLAKERRKTWNKEVKQIVPWAYNSSFIWPQGTETIIKGKETHDQTGAPIARIARLTKAGRDIIGEREESEANKNRKVLTDCLTLWVPDYAETPASYEPPAFECTKPSLPNNFAMRPGSRLITELEAMNLFLLRRYELGGLERKSINAGSALDSSEGLDYNEVQQRAMDCHGGFDGHNRKILDLSNEAVSKNDWDWRTFPEDLMIEFALSPIALKKKCNKTELDDKAFLEVWWPPYDPMGVRFMRQVCAPGHCDGCRMEAAPDFALEL